VVSIGFRNKTPGGEAIPVRNHEWREHCAKGLCPATKDTTGKDALFALMISDYLNHWDESIFVFKVTLAAI
jgi:hypothetical protein